MKDQKLKKVIQTPNLVQYKLNKTCKDSLAQFDKMAAYAQAGARPPPNFIRLPGDVYAMIDRDVKRQSDGKFDASKVNWFGRSLVKESAAAPQFNLEASP